MAVERTDYSYTKIKDADGKLREVTLMPSTIETIDQAFYNWVDDSINASADTNKGFKKVPVIWIAAERAHQIKNNRDSRDLNGVLKLPQLIVNRTALTKDSAFKGTAWAHIPNTPDARGGALTVARRIGQDKTANFLNADSARKFGTLSGTSVGHGQRNYPGPKNDKVVYETITMPIPVYVKAEYSVTARTNYQIQLNQIVTPFITRTGQINNFFMSHEGHRFEGFIENDFLQSLDVTGEDESSYESVIKFRVLGYLLGGGINEERPKITIRENAVEVKFPRERVITGDSPEFNPKKGIKAFYR